MFRYIDIAPYIRQSGTASTDVMISQLKALASSLSPEVFDCKFCGTVVLCHIAAVEDFSRILGFTYPHHDIVECCHKARCAALQCENLNSLHDKMDWFTHICKQKAMLSQEGASIVKNVLDMESEITALEIETLISRLALQISHYRSEPSVA